MKARTGFAIVVVGTLAILSFLVVRPFLGYVLGAILLAFVFTPLQRRLAPAVGKQVSAVVLVVLAAVLVIGPVVGLVAVGLVEVESIPTSVDDLRGLRSVQESVESLLGIQLEPIIDRVFSGLTAGIGEQTSRIAEAGVHAFLGLLLLVFLLYYLLKDGDEFVAWTKRVTPLPRDVQDELYAEAEDATWAVLKGHIFVALVQGFVAGLGLFATGVPNAAFWTGVMVFLALVPIVGVAPVLGGAAVYLAIEGRPLAGVLVVVYGLTIVALVDDYLRAMVIEKGSSLHSAVILLGVFGAAYFLGPIGLFVGPIILALFKATVEVFSEYYGLSAF
ncbi:AI-2E family transporter [Halorussus salilacus]|uniref:AI-2E family transporter n=1 Tax=Halorussus salilacus TaxID=2953750 RepID=UPI0020A03439|nr:AI-2E family transporter [Halorussus salilacus]USZ66662.1 AI-2E family transporter [Halorussus salilacus]